MQALGLGRISKETKGGDHIDWAIIEVWHRISGSLHIYSLTKRFNKPDYPVKEVIKPPFS